MDQAVAHALTVFRNDIAGEHQRHRVAASVVGS
jgi:hypothetical protein